LGELECIETGTTDCKFGCYGDLEDKNCGKNQHKRIENHRRKGVHFSGVSCGSLRGPLFHSVTEAHMHVLHLVRSSATSVLLLRMPYFQKYDCFRQNTSEPLHNSILTKASDDTHCACTSTTMKSMNNTPLADLDSMLKRAVHETWGWHIYRCT